MIKQRTSIKTFSDVSMYRSEVYNAKKLRVSHLARIFTKYSDCPLVLVELLA